jgi:transcriptional regulator with GAF, ATPase, and Fis domain
MITTHRTEANVCRRTRAAAGASWRVVRPGASPPFQLPADGVNLEDVEGRLVVQALDRAGGNQTQAAHLPGLNRDQVRYRVEKSGLPVHHRVGFRRTRAG